ncbi:MAG: hypothetical protein ACERKN_14030 [Velocimicrobium sp.]
MEEKKFKELYLNGEIEFDEIDRYSQRWGMSDDIRTLREYLGLDVQEEDAWISVGEEELKHMLEEQKMFR